MVRVWIPIAGCDVVDWWKVECSNLPVSEIDSNIVRNLKPMIRSAAIGIMKPGIGHKPIAGCHPSL